MNYNEHIANDLLDTHKVRTLKTDENNKENAQATGKYLANVSISSLGAGILSETQLNMSNNGLLSSASFFNPNESFDCDKIKLDAYEKSVTKLENENKQLRKRVKKLTELAREKEQEIIESLNTFTEEKQKLEQKNQQEFQSQLQTYYECFLSIEKENDQLKRKTDKMRNKLIEQQDKLEELSRSKQNDDVQSTVESIMISSTLADGTDENEIILNTMSMRHINDELNNATKTAESFIEKAIFLESSQREDQDTSVDTNLLKQEIEQLKQKIDELTLEKVALEKKFDSIEKSLQRWIFRACDDQCNLKKLEEKCEKLEADIKTLTSENQRIKAAKESETKLLELSQIQLNDTQLILDQTRLLLTDKENHINRLTTLSNQLEVENQELVLRLENYWNKVFCNMGTQTEVQNNNKTTSSCSKLNELAAVNNGHVAKTAAKFNTNTNTNTNQPAGLHPQTSSSDVNPELKSVKIKNDNLIIEKSQLKFKNDELKFENDELKLKIEDLLKQIESNKSMHASTASVSVNTTNLKTKQQTASPRPAVFSQSVQTIKLAISNQETQTNQVLLHHTVSNNSGSDLLLKARFETVKLELEHSKSESLSEMNRLKLNLIAKTTQCSHMEQSIAKMNNDHKKEKQILDTKICQQKKLLDFLQNKINPDDQDSAHTNNNQAGQFANSNNGSLTSSTSSHTGKLMQNYSFMYSDSFMVDELMKNRPHIIDGRQVEPKRATPREDSGKTEVQMTVKKLFIGGLRDNITEDDLKRYFGNYGSIVEAVVMKEKESSKSRGFGFVTFDDYDPVDKIILEKNHVINGVNVHTQKALPKDFEKGGPNNNNNNNNNNGNNRQGNRNNNFSNDNFNYNNQGNNFNTGYNNPSGGYQNKGQFNKGNGSMLGIQSNQFDNGFSNSSLNNTYGSYNQAPNQPKMNAGGQNMPMMNNRMGGGNMGGNKMGGGPGPMRGGGRFTNRSSGPYGGSGFNNNNGNNFNNNRGGRNMGGRGGSGQRRGSFPRQNNGNNNNGGGNGNI